MSSGFFMLTLFLRHMPWSISVRVLKRDLHSAAISACCSMARRVLPGSLLPSTRCCASLVYAMLRRFRYLCQAGRLSPDWRLPFTATFRRSGLAPAFAPSRSFCPSELPDHNLLTPIRTTQLRPRVAALDDVATAVLVRSFTELALPLVPSRSSRERVKSIFRAHLSGHARDEYERNSRSISTIFLHRLRQFSSIVALQLSA